MTTGLFLNRTAGPGLALRAHQRARRLGKLDAFAEALVIHGDVARASAAVGVSKATGDTYLSRIRKQLGWQAV